MKTTNLILESCSSDLGVGDVGAEVEDVEAELLTKQGGHRHTQAMPLPFEGGKQDGAAIRRPSTVVPQRLEAALDNGGDEVFVTDLELA